MCEDRDSTKVVERIERKAERKLERKKAKIERERAKIMRKWDERTIQQKKLDRRILIFLTISAGVLVKALSPGVE
jgi:hypothetical protein